MDGIDYLLAAVEELTEALHASRRQESMAFWGHIQVARAACRAARLRRETGEETPIERGP
jgi:hypothetical protein